jgi:hypothetical protein
MIGSPVLGRLGDLGVIPVVVGGARGPLRIRVLGIDGWSSWSEEALVHLTPKGNQAA